MPLGHCTLIACVAALLLVTKPGQAQTGLQSKVAVPELCSADSAAVFLGFAVREVRAARVFATTPAQRLALLALEAATVEQIDQAPLLPGVKEAVYGIFQREDQAWERAARETIEGRDTMPHEAYRYYVDQASQELGVKCHGSLRWPGLHAEARDAAAL